MIGGEVAADARKYATRLAASRFDFGRFATQSVHVGRWAAQIRDHAREALDLVSNVFNFTQHGSFAPALNNSALVLRDGAKCAATKAATHDVHREANHLPCWYFGSGIVRAIFVGINGVWAACIGQVKHGIHFGSGERNRRWRDPNISGCYTLSVGLNQTARIARVGF